MIKRNIKMAVTPEESKQVQEICFANGIVWEIKQKECSFTDRKFLYIDDYLTWGSLELSFKENPNEEVDAKFFIKTQGLCVEENQEQELKQNIEEEQMKDNEVETYKDVKEYLVAKGLYDRVMEIEWDGDATYTEFSDLFTWGETTEGFDYWSGIDDDLIKLSIEYNIESLVQDYKAKPKQYLVFVPSKGKPKHIHQSLESAQEEAKRLCKSGLCDVMVLEVVSKYQAKVIVEEV